MSGAYSEAMVSVTLEASGDLSDYQYYLVKSGTGERRVSVNTSAGGAVVGVLQNKPDAVGAAATVAISGVVPVIAGDAIDAMAQVTSDSSGRVVAYSETDVIVGRALQAATAAGDIISVLLQPYYA
jgi:hypothetical protein